MLIQGVIHRSRLLRSTSGTARGPDASAEESRALRAVRAACPAGRIIGSGGITDGLEAAKALWLGASLVSMAGPVLRALTGDGRGKPDADAAIEVIERWKSQLRLTLFLTGASNLDAFAAVPGHVSGHMAGR